MLAEVDNKEDSTIHLYKSILYKMYAIMQNLHSTKAMQWILTRQSPNEQQCEALHFSTKHGSIQCWTRKLFLDFKMHSQCKHTLNNFVIHTKVKCKY